MVENSDIESIAARQAPVQRVSVAERVFDRLSRQIAFFLQCVLFLGLVSLVVVAIAELAARDSMLTMVTARGAALKSEFVERSRAGDPLNAPSQELLIRAQRTILDQVESVEDLKRRIQSLNALGVETSAQSLRAIQRDFVELNRLIERGAAPSATSLPDTSFPTNFSLESLRDTLVLSILRYGSDQLLAIVVLGCGAIGAMISSLRSRQSLSLRSFVLGLASGFVAYLVIKGGKHVFLMQIQGEIVAFNPYGTAFAGLLAGLFTEKAHQLLSFLVDDLANRIRAASENASNRMQQPPGIEHDNRGP